MELRNKRKATVTNRLEDMGEEAGRSKVECLGGDAGDVDEGDASMHHDAALGAPEEVTSSSSRDGLMGE